MECLYFNVGGSDYISMSEGVTIFQRPPDEAALVQQQKESDIFFFSSRIVWVSRSYTRFMYQHNRAARWILQQRNIDTPTGCYNT